MNDGNEILAGLDFRGTMRDAAKGLLVKPVLHNYLFDAEFPDFDMKFRNHQMNRPPDDWFHPSTHPLWPENALHHYLANPTLMLPEKKEYMGSLAITIGTAMHGLIEVCMEDAGIRPKALNTCTTCKPECERPVKGKRGLRCGCARNDGPLTAKGVHKELCTEPGTVDPVTKARGHMDGILDLSSMSTPSEIYDEPVFEMKTMNDRKQGTIPDLDLDVYRAKCPVYYAQNQEYMRMTGKRMTIVFIMTLGWPFGMSEIHVPYDVGFVQGIKDKYMRVRQAVADQRPLACCGRLKTCPAGNACRIVAANQPTTEPRTLWSL